MGVTGRDDSSMAMSSREMASVAAVVVLNGFSNCWRSERPFFACAFANGAGACADVVPEGDVRRVLAGGVACWLSVTLAGVAALWLAVAFAAAFAANFAAASAFFLSSSHFIDGGVVLLSECQRCWKT